MIKNKEMVAAEVYQAVGVLLEDADRFDTEEGQTLLDACSFLAGNRDAAPTKQLLPFSSKQIDNRSHYEGRISRNTEKSVIERIQERKD